MEIITLENGLRVLFEPREDQRSATVGVWVASGSSEENEKNNGISHFIEHIVFKGSRTRTAFEIAEGMDSIGASVNAYTTKEFTFFYTRALDYHIEEAVDILFEMITRPRLDEKDIETEKGVILEEIAMCGDDPSDVCYEANESAIFSSSPLALQILGTNESVSAIKREDFVSQLEKVYVPERIVIGAAGKFDKEKILEKINSYFSALKNTGNAITKKDAPFKKGTTLVKRDFEQTHLMLSFPGIPLVHEDFFALKLCTFILGTGSSSRLNQRLREQLGLVYSVDSWLCRYLAAGYISCSMSLSAGNQKKALEEMCREIRRFPESVTDRELSVAKEKIISGLIMSREQPGLSPAGSSLLLLSKVIDDDTIISKIKGITLDELRKVGLKYFDLQKAALTAVGKTEEKEVYENIIKG